MGPRGPLSSFPLVGGEGVSRPLCRPSSPLGRASFSAVAPATPTPGAGYPLVRLPICLSLMLTRASRGAAPEGVPGWRGPCLPSCKHWGSGIPASRSRTPEPPRDRVPSSLPALHPGLSLNMVGSLRGPGAIMPGMGATLRLLGPGRDSSWEYLSDW